MHPWIALGVVLVLQSCLASPDTTNDRSQFLGERTRRHDTEERPSSGRRWTTSRNSPYQKIVSSYEQDVPEEGSAEQAKAKSSKRKPLRTSAQSHDQIPSETSVDDGSFKVDSDTTVSEVEDIQDDKKSFRRRSSSGNVRDISSEQPVEPNPKKRRRITTTSTTLSPQTMSDSLYQYFRPLERDVPQDDIIPFLDFGRKLSPVIPTPSGANSIDNKSMVTKLKPRNQYDDKESHSTDEELLQEDMDVTVVKKAIERNSVPRGKLRVREQGISDYYRKRGPVRTTENLISTSDSSTASSVTSPKNYSVLKKINRHQVHLEPPVKSVEEELSDPFPLAESSHYIKSVEVSPDKRRHHSRPAQRLSAVKHESSQTPLTAESSLVKTVIKDIIKEEISQREIKEEENKTTVDNVPTKVEENNTKSENKSLNNDDSISKALHQAQNLTSEGNSSSKVLSTAVVTSISVQESLEHPQIESATDYPNRTLYNNDTIISPLPLSTLGVNNSLDIRPLSIKNTNRSKEFTLSKSTTTPTPEISTTTVKSETSLRSRDIYKPKTKPPGSLIPHLPRTIANLTQNVNVTTRTTSSSINRHTTEIAFKQTPSNLNTTTLRTTTTKTTSSTPSSTSITPPTTLFTSSSTFTPAEITTRTVTPTEIKSATAKTPVIPEEQQQLLNKQLKNTTKDILLVPDSLDLQFSTVQATVQEVTTPKQSSSTTTRRADSDVSSKFNASVNEGMADQSSSDGTDFVPPSENEDFTEPVVIVPVLPTEEKDVTEDQYQVYFTVPASTTAPVVDTRPDSENSSSPVPSSTRRPGVDWVKLGAVEKEVEVVYPEPMSLGAYLLAALGVLPVIIGALIGARFLLAHNKKKVLDESEYSSEYNRSPLGFTNTPLATKLPRIATHMSWNETEKSPLSAPSVIPSGRWEFPRDKLRLQTLLGQGNFGQVWKAEADDIAGHEGLTRLVAVKTVKECANAREREDLLRELGIMQELGSHPNVVTLLGCCTEKEPIYVVMEYVMFGKLLSFLRDHRTRSHYYNFSDATDALTSRDLTVFAYCVARGMDYLTNKSIIHRDIAARNVLVDHNKLCKIADFGMSRNVRDTGQIYEQRQSKGALPIRWMAPESLHFSLFTHKTDVWSFGILMWEIVTLGSTPYATMGAREVMKRVRDGYRLERPTHCHSQLFRVIDRCWHSEPSKRPSFAELKAELAQLLSDSEHRGSFVDLDSYADEMRRDSLHRH